METSALTFLQPVWFFALLIVPVVAALYFWSQKRSDSLIAKVVAPRLRAQLAGAVSVGRRAFKSVLILATFALLAVALARPQMGFTQREVKQRGRDVIIAVDTSRSMLATDVSPTRLARAKLVAQDLLRLVRGDRVGLVAFAGSAFLQAPLTLDYNAVMTSLDELDTTVIPKGGTNIAAAIRTAEEAFGKGEGQTRALIILTDGEELDADGIAAAKKATSQGVRIFTVGIGSGEGSLIPLRNEGSGTDFVRDSAGKPVQSRLDETRLKEIAEAGGGFYEPLSADVARSIFEKGIVPIEQVETGKMTSRQPIERYQWPLGAAVALLALWLLLGDRKRGPKAVRRAAVAAALLVACAPAGLAATGIEEYQAGDFDKARANFEARLQASPGSDKLQFNAGAAAYKTGDYGKAVDHFTNALLSKDRKLHEDASYNLANALVRRGESVQAKEEKKADWKNAIQHYTEALNIDAKNKQAEENREIVKKMLEDLEKEEKKEQEKQDKQDKQDQKQDQKQKDQKQDKQDQKDQKDQKDKQDQKNQDQKQDQQKQDQQQDKNQDKNDQQKDQSGQSGQDQKDQDKQQQDQKQPDGGKDEEKEDQPKPDEQKDGEKKDQEKPEPKDGDQKKDQGDQDMAKNNPQQGGQQKDQQPAPQPTPGEKKQGDLKAGQNEPQQAPEDQKGEAQPAEAAEKDGEMSPAQARSLLNSLRSEEGRVQLMQTKEPEDTLKDW